MELKLVSEDERRKLSEFGNGGTWKVCKVLEFKQDALVGNHYHKKKDEMFVLLSGEGLFFVRNNQFNKNPDYTLAFSDGEYRIAPYSVFIKRGTKHAFNLKKGSVLICLASQEHDPKDDYKL
jgi:quercetin dioxygenase-like cupin family protein